MSLIKERLKKCMFRSKLANIAIVLLVLVLAFTVGAWYAVPIAEESDRNSEPVESAENLDKEAGSLLIDSPEYAEVGQKYGELVLDSVEGDDEYFVTKFSGDVSLRGVYHPPNRLRMTAENTTNTLDSLPRTGLGLDEIRFINQKTAEAVFSGSEDCHVEAKVSNFILEGGSGIHSARPMAILEQGEKVDCGEYSKNMPDQSSEPERLTSPFIPFKSAELGQQYGAFTLEETNHAGGERSGRKYQFDFTGQATVRGEYFVEDIQGLGTISYGLKYLDKASLKKLPRQHPSQHSWDGWRDDYFNLRFHNPHEVHPKPLVEEGDIITVIIDRYTYRVPGGGIARVVEVAESHE